MKYESWVSDSKKEAKPAKNDVVIYEQPIMINKGAILFESQKLFICYKHWWHSNKRRLAVIQYVDYGNNIICIPSGHWCDCDVWSYKEAAR